ncbi:MAG: methyltransferase domain-containing protein [Acidobacteriota bacterium]
MQFIDGPPGGPDAWRDVWQEDRRFRPRPSKWDFFLRFFRRLVNRAAEAESERQRNFNVALLDLIADLRRDIEGVRDDLKRDLAAVQLDVRQADEALAAEVARIRELIPVAAKRNDSLIAALDQKIETVAVRVRDVTNPVVQSAGGPPRSEDFVYRRLEDALRGDVDVAHYAALARDHQPLLDVGCGRGELLDLCRAAGIDAHGFDTNERSIADLRARGLSATLAGVPECFNAIDDGSIGAIAALHVVEHVPPLVLFVLFREASRVLRPGGLLMIETPNAESIAVSASDFWRDPTHLAPRHPAALILLGREHGFDVEEVRAIHPFPEGNRLTATEDDAPSVRALVDALNERLFGGQDLRLVLRKA